MTKASTLLEMIKALIDRPLSINDMATRFGVSSRTIKRYLSDIRRSRITLICYQEYASTPARFSIRPITRSKINNK